jgi:arylsulfatase A-like enzyme
MPQATFLYRHLIVILLALPTLTATAQQQPNILLVLSDDHSAPYLGTYGHSDLVTPHLDSLAARGVRFDQAYTAAAQCVPSRATILSGRNVVDVRMSRFSAPLPREVKTLPEYLDSAGYYTGICGRHYHLDGSGRKAEETIAAFEKYDLVTFPDRVDYLREGSDDEVVEQFKNFLDEVPDEAPFFMWMNYSDPHRPFTASDYAPDPATLTVPTGMPDTEEVRKDLAEHYGEIMRLDAHFGQVMQVLRQRELADHTIVIFMGDNGAALLRGKGTLYDLGLHVPLIAAGPGIATNTTSDAMISGIDIAPTILELAGRKAPEVMEGRSFVPALKGEDYTGHELIFAARVPHSSGLPTATDYFDLGRTVFDRRYKLIYNALWQLPYTPVDFKGRPMWRDLQRRNDEGQLEAKFSQVLFANPRALFELYDLQTDPDEMHNLIGKEEYAQTEHRLKAALHEWMVHYQDYLPLPITP